LLESTLRRENLASKIAACFLPFAAGYFLSYLYRTVNAVIGPYLIRDLGLDAGSLGLLTSAYFVTFAAIQLPLGILLDRFGPRRVEAVLLLCAAAGAIVFALARDVAELTAGRALIGLGVSSCLMAAFKANVQFWPSGRLALANGFLLAFGGLGATVATLPVEWIVRTTDWRTLFLILAGTTVLVSVVIWTAVPEREQSVGDGLREQIAGVGAILRSARFWLVAPVTVTTQATYLSYQSLWAGPWLRDVAGMSGEAAASVLFLMAAAMIPGFAFGGLLADRLTRAGIRQDALVLAFTGAFIAVQIPLVLNVIAGSGAMWIAFGLLGTGTVLGYACLTRQFPADAAGRVNTAVNLLVFVGAFVAQAGIGAIIDLFPKTGAGYPPAGFQTGFGLVLAIQLAAWLWLAMRRRPDDP
jgi:predicted MFS family arabinose efflux permease